MTKVPTLCNPRVYALRSRVLRFMVWGGWYALERLRGLLSLAAADTRPNRVVGCGECVGRAGAMAEDMEGGQAAEVWKSSEAVSVR